MRPTAPTVAAAALVALAAGAAEGGRGGAVVRLEHPAADRLRVEAGWFVMGIRPRDVTILREECEQATNIIVYTAGPGGVPASEDHLCVLWQAALERRGPRTVWIDGFTIDRTEVSQAAYRRCVHAGTCSPEPLLAAQPGHAGPDQPVAWITRAEAASFCAWRGGRLPTEAEWEKAARGSDGRTWPWGERGRPEHVNHGKARDPVLQATERVHNSSAAGGNRLLGDPDASDGFRYAAPVGHLRWTRGPHGTVDQAGNVAEWVADDWSDDGYDGLPLANPQRVSPAPTAAVTRGGSWRDPLFLARTDTPPYAAAFPMGAVLAADTRALHIGVRCVYGGALPDTSTRRLVLTP